MPQYRHSWLSSRRQHVRADQRERLSDTVIDLTGERPRRIVAGWRRLRIAMIGQKGLPATYGGIERHVEEVAYRLAEFGHDVHVFCRDNYSEYADSEYRGIQLHRVPTIGTKHFDAIAHSTSSTLSAIRISPDIMHYHALGPGLLAPIPRYLTGAKVVLTVHGLDHERAKWGLAGRLALGRAHWMSARIPDRTVVVSRALAEHYDWNFNRASSYIPNGVESQEPRPAALIESRFGLKRGSYVLYVGRLVPEKAADLLIRAFRTMGGSRRLVITGDSSFSDEYVRKLRELAADDSRIIFTGFLYGDILNELYSNAAAFVIPSYVEGLPLTLLEAASYGTPIVASDISPHAEVLGLERPGRRLFPAGDMVALVAALQRSLVDPVAEQAGAQELKAEIQSSYNWYESATRLERIYLDLDRQTREQKPPAGSSDQLVRHQLPVQRGEAPTSDHQPIDHHPTEDLSSL